MDRSSEESVPPYRSLTQIIAKSMRQRIYEGEYTAGTRLRITELAREFGSSPVPVREALRNLETEGLIEFQVNRGVIIRGLSYADVRELFLIRAPLEALAAAEAARMASTEEIDELEATATRMDRSTGTDAWHRDHSAFHETLYGICRLPRLIRLIDSLRGQMRPYSRIYLNDLEHVAQAQKEHREMVACLRARDPERIAEIVHEHLERPARMAMAASEQDSTAGDHASSPATNSGNGKKLARQRKAS